MVYKWYILPIGGLYATYHPLQEPEESIEFARLAMVSATSVEEKMTTIFTKKKSKKNMTKFSLDEVAIKPIWFEIDDVFSELPNNGFVDSTSRGYKKTWSFKTWLKGCSNTCSSWSPPLWDHEVGRIQ